MAAAKTAWTRRDVICIVHGGAGYIPDASAATARAGVRAAAAAGDAVLVAGGSALDGVEAAVRSPEDAPFFKAGTGSVLNRAGFVEMDALVADGRTLAAGAVAGIRRVKNPVSVARAVMTSSPHVLLGGEGADAFAAAHGARVVDPGELITPARREGLARVLAEEAAAAAAAAGSGSVHPAAAAAAAGFVTTEPGAASARTLVSTAATVAAAAAAASATAASAADAGDHDTVGAVAIDGWGNIAAATSTGGLTGKLVGRIGDTPLFGAGGYADNSVGGVSVTGTGEFIIRSLLSKTVCDAWEADAARPAGMTRAAAAVRAALARMHRKVGSDGAGVIFIAPDGEVGVGHSSERMSWAVCRGHTDHTFEADSDVELPVLDTSVVSVDTGATVEMRVLPTGPRFTPKER